MDNEVSDKSMDMKTLEIIATDLVRGDHWPSGRATDRGQGCPQPTAAEI